MSLIGLPSLPKLPSGKGIFNNLLAIGQGQLWQLLTLQPIWGIYEAGSSTTLAVEVTSVQDVSISEESDVPDYRLQTGSFASYNKVVQPKEISMTITKSGSDTERQAFVTWLQQNVNQPTVFDILTADAVFQNLTLKAYDYDRTADNGMDLVIAQCQFLEVREAPEQYYDAQQGMASTQNTGDADAIPTVHEKKVEIKPAGTIGERVQSIFSLDRLKPIYESVKTTASSIVTSIQNTVTSYYQKVKEWFSK